MPSTGMVTWSVALFGISTYGYKTVGGGVEPSYSIGRALCCGVLLVHDTRYCSNLEEALPKTTIVIRLLTSNLSVVIVDEA